ncbi:hypothetical protein GCM10010433_05680 [Streptomyces pulveraceus]|uniref:Uncharacterized protein n=1 Tax=Streptomyces pulveraceus TaxID=68258 RepID=A0ABW1GRN5_9ACTN
MTELSTEPVAGDTAATAPAPVTPKAESPAPSTTPQSAKATVAHTPGGWPALPLAVTGTNSAVSALAAAALAGGPVAAAVAATGACALGAAAVSRTRRTRAASHAATGATHRTGVRAGGRSGASRMSASHASGSVGRAGARTARGTNRAGGKSTGAGVSLGKQRTPHQSRGGPASASARHGQTAPAKPRSAGPGSGGSGRIGQVKELRAAQKTAAPTRAAQRTQTTAARRVVADTRRAAKAAARTTPATASGKSPSGRGGGSGASGPTRARRPGRLGRARAVVAAKARAMREKHRQRRDQRTEHAVEGKRAAVRKAPARRAARRALWRSAARFQQRHLLAVVLAAPVGVLGLLTTPLGRRLGWPWLMHPGRRLYRLLLDRAQQEKADRDAAIRARIEEEEAAADAADEQDPNDIADQVERPAHLVPSTTPAVISGGENVSGFKFEEAATEMQAAAMLYEPDGCMEILAMVDGLPEALKMIAHVMQILAERSDSEFPLEKEVAAGFNDIYDLLLKASAGAEELPDIFRRVHEKDIARHEDPRNGTEAEKGWNV